VAIGRYAGLTGQHNNSIVINATGSALNSGTSNATYLAPIRNVTQSEVMGYDTSSKELTYFSMFDTIYPVGIVIGNNTNTNPFPSNGTWVSNGPFSSTPTIYFWRRTA
jgi:hypothetical protein